MKRLKPSFPSSRFKVLPLNDRHQRILRATVKSYIDTAEPVGSKTLTRQYDFGLSPATIRNAMAALEEWGLLFQPHTSAGRIPSDSGYRVYVDELLAPPTQLIQQMRQALSDYLLEERHQELEGLLQSAARILASLSGCVALITVPRSALARVRHLQLVGVDEGRVLMIVVTDSLQTRSFLLDLPSPRLVDELELINNFLNAELYNRTLSDLSPAWVDELCHRFHQYADFLRTVSTLLKKVLQPMTGQVFISGVGEILRQPEFAEPERIQSLVQLLEDERERLSLLITPSDTHEQVVVRIGAENPLEPMQFCSLVSGTYCYNQVPVGSLGVLGPTRLPYDRAIASVRATAEYLSATLALAS